jgi:hypothetical protein
MRLRATKSFRIDRLSLESSSNDEMKNGETGYANRVITGSL